MKTVERFSDRAENYVKFRPDYPPEVLDMFKRELGLKVESMIADIGSGTGISARMFLENGNTVYGVEPNEAMRTASLEYLKEFSSFHAIEATAENTGIEDASIDIVVSAQAFHWFDQAAARKEFQRILRPDGYAALIWNQRQVNTTPFLGEYEGFLLGYANDYVQVRHENVNEETLHAFFGKPFRHRTFQNLQVLNFEGLRGRVMSSSYMPTESDDRYLEMIDELKTLFAKHAENGRIKIFYDTNVFYSHL